MQLFSWVIIMSPMKLHSLVSNASEVSVGWMEGILFHDGGTYNLTKASKSSPPLQCNNVRYPGRGCGLSGNTNQFRAHNKGIIAVRSRKKTMRI